VPSEPPTKGCPSGLKYSNGKPISNFLTDFYVNSYFFNAGDINWVAMNSFTTTRE